MYNDQTKEKRQRNIKFENRNTGKESQKESTL